MSFFNTDLIVTSSKGLQFKDIGTTGNTAPSGNASIYVNGNSVYFRLSSGSEVELTGTSSSSTSLQSLTDTKIDDSSNFLDSFLIQLHTIGNAPTTDSLNVASNNFGLGGYNYKSTEFLPIDNNNQINYIDVSGSPTGTATYTNSNNFSSSVNITSSNTSVASDMTTVKNIIITDGTTHKIYAATQSSGTITMVHGHYFTSSENGQTITYSDSSTSPSTATASVSIASGESFTHTISSSSSKTITIPEHITLNGKTFSIIQSGFTITLSSTFCSLGHGDNNVSIGNSSTMFLKNSVSNANYNIAIGHSSGQFNQNGERSILIGNQTAMSHINTRENVLIGHKAGGNTVRQNNFNDVGSNTLTSRNTLIGFNTEIDTSSWTSVPNQIVIGYNTTGVGNSYTTIGNSNITALYAGDDGGGYFYTQEVVTSSDRRIKKNINDLELGINFIEKLRPVKYNLKQPTDYDDDLKTNLTWYKKNKKSREHSDYKLNKIQYGLIAQEVEAVLDEFSISKNNNIVYIEDSGLYSLDYNKLIPSLIKSIQELNKLAEEQQTNIDNLKTTAN